MQLRKCTLLLTAVMLMVVGGFGAVLAAPRAQEDNGAEQNTDVSQMTARVTQAYLGVKVAPLTEAIRDALELPVDLEGVVAAGTAAGSPAQKSRLHRGDVILAIDGREITNPNQLREIVAMKLPGDSLALRVFRENSVHQITVVLAKRPYHRPNPRLEQAPAWLKKAYTFVNQFPHTVDAEIRMFNDKEQVVTRNLILGTVQGVGKASLVIEPRIGESARYEIVEGTLMVKKFQRVRLRDLEPGDRVVVLEKDGVVEAVVAGSLQAALHGIQTTRDSRPSG